MERVTKRNAQSLVDIFARPALAEEEMAAVSFAI